MIMKKLTKILLVCALVLALGGSALSSALAITASQAIKDWRQRNSCDVLTLRARISALEDTLGKGLTALAEKVTEVQEVFAPAEGNGDENNGPDGNGENDIQAGEEVSACPAGDEAPDQAAGEVTLNEAHAADPVTIPYVVATYRGIIGVFDGEGNLLRTVNVSVSTLPATDREALDDGIQAASWQDMMDIVGQYQ
jgi:hypothetical protein